MGVWASDCWDERRAFCTNILRQHGDLEIPPEDFFDCTTLGGGPRDQHVQHIGRHIETMSNFLRCPSAKCIFQDCRRRWVEHIRNRTDPYRAVFVCDDGKYRSVAMATLMQHWFLMQNAHIAKVIHCAEIAGQWEDLCTDCDDCRHSQGKEIMMDQFIAWAGF